MDDLSDVGGYAGVMAALPAFFIVGDMTNNLIYALAAAVATMVTIYIAGKVFWKHDRFIGALSLFFLYMIFFGIAAGIVFGFEKTIYSQYIFFGAIGSVAIFTALLIKVKDFNKAYKLHFPLWFSAVLIIFSVIAPVYPDLYFSPDMRVISPTIYAITAAAIAGTIFSTILSAFFPYLGKAVGREEQRALEPPLQPERASEKPPSYRASDGHYVRSKGELVIDNWLTAHGILHEYEPQIPNTKYYADFYIPSFDTYIEYWGLDTPEYNEKRSQKQKLYKELGLECIDIYETDLADLDTAFSKLQRGAKNV